MPRSRTSRRLAPAAVTSLAGALVAAVLLAVSLAGGATATGARSTATTSASQGSTPTRAHVGGHLGGKHARVAATSSVIDHLKDQHLDLTALPPTPDPSHVTLAADVASAPDVLATPADAPLADSRGPPVA